MNTWRKTGAGAAAVILAVTGVGAFDAPAAPAAAAGCGPVDIIGGDKEIELGGRADYDIDPAGCDTGEYSVDVSDTEAFGISVTPTHVSVTARKEVTDASATVTIKVKRLLFDTFDDAVVVSLLGGDPPPRAWVTLCVRDSGEDPRPQRAWIRLSRVTPVDVQFGYSFKSGTASAADFTPLGQGYGVVPAGSHSAPIPFLLNVDQLVEGRESFLLMITSISGASILDGGGSCRNEIVANGT